MNHPSDGTPLETSSPRTPGIGAIKALMNRVRQPRPLVVRGLNVWMGTAAGADELVADAWQVPGAHCNVQLLFFVYLERISVQPMRLPNYSGFTAFVYLHTIILNVTLYGGPRGEGTFL